MEKIEIFQILEIEPTRDEKVIKNAYREKLSVTNPEDNPEGFKRLRTAFEEAVRLAKMPEESENAEDEKDETPSGLWVARAAEIYKNMITRQDVTQWKKLFNEDIFLSLEEEENCRFKLLRFMMDHYKLPTEVWKLLDRKLNIVADIAQLREHFPADYISFIASKCERGEDVVFTQFGGEPEAPYDLFLQYYEQCYRALDAGELGQAEELLGNADNLKIFHPVMEVCRAGLYEKQGKITEAIALLSELQERFSQDVMVCYNCAEMMWRNEQKQEAASIFERIKSENDTHYMANVRLSEWYFEQKQYQAAKKCAEKVLSCGGDDQFMKLLKKINKEIEIELEEKYSREQDYESGLELGWCYLQDGSIHKGIRLAKELETKVPDEKASEYNGLLTKLYMEETEYEKALEMAEKWYQALQKRLDSDESEEEKDKDRDRVRQYHVIKMHCFQALGNKKSEDNQEERICYYNRALEEAEKVETGGTGDISLLLEKAQIYKEMEEYEKCLEITQRLISDYQVYAAYATEAEVYRRQWNAGGVIQAARQCITYFPSYIRAYEHMAKVYLDLKRNEDLLSILEEAKQNGIKSVLLDAYRYQMDKEIPGTDELNEKLDAFRKVYNSAVGKGNLTYYEKGLPILTEYLYWYPGTYMLTERAIFHRAAHHYQEAIEDFEKVLAEEPNHQYALYGLSVVYKYMGDYEKALILIKRAIRYRDADMSHVIFADMANLYSLLGDNQEALRAYEEFEEYDNYASKYHMDNLAMCLARCGEVEKAVAILKQAHENSILEYYDEAVNIYQITGMKEKAQELLAEWNKKMQNVQKTLSNENYAAYYSCAAWQDLLYGNGRQAMALVEKELKFKEHVEHKVTLSDAVFIAALCGDDEKGRFYSAKLREVMAKEKDEGKDDFFNREKAGLQTKFLMNYYCMSEEELEEMLGTEQTSEICHFCTYCICKELEAVRVLFMLRRGRIEEAMERINRNLEKQPLDSYMLAIRHMCQEGVKVTGSAALKAEGTAKEKVALDVREEPRASLLGNLFAGIFGKKK